MTYKTKGEWAKQCQTLFMEEHGLGWHGSSLHTEILVELQYVVYGDALEDWDTPQEAVDEETSYWTN